MTQEEKAKRYDELKVTAQELEHDGCFDKITLFDLFPELRESEDERIRKAIIATIHLYYGEPLEDEAKEMIAWLEKQGEQKPVEPQQDMLSQEKYAKAVDECIYGEQKPAEDKGMNLVEEEMTPFQKKVFCIIDTTIEEEQGLKQVCDELLRLAHDEIMQNTAWSEDDKRIIDNLVSQLCNLYARKLIKEETKDKYVDWLKSLKDRVLTQPQEQSQPKGLSDDFEEELDRYIKENFYGSACDGFFSNRTKRELEAEDVVRIACHFAAWQKELSKKDALSKPKQEWSKEDEETLKDIITSMTNLKDSATSDALRWIYDSKINWLESLKGRYTWKPSDEQMGVIEAVINNRSFQRRHLDSLYADLKKLREE